MDAGAISEMQRAEQAHFWFYGSRKIILSLLTQHLPHMAGRRRLVDIGCGSGFTMAQASQHGEWIGVDLSRHALQLAREQATGGRWVQASAESLPFADDSVDGAIALDIFEHLDDDLAASMEIRRILKPTGIGVVAVPSWPCLFGPHDVALQHRRRYSRDAFRRLLQHAGLRIIHLTSYNFLLLPAVAAVRLARRGLDGVRRGSAALLAGERQREAKSDLGLSIGWLNRPLGRILASERHLVGRLPLRGGISLVAVVKAGW